MSAPLTPEDERRICLSCALPDCFPESPACGLKNHRVQSSGNKRAKYERAYRATKKEKIAEYQKAYRAANKEKINEYQKAYRAANKEKVKARTERLRENQLEVV